MEPPPSRWLIPDLSDPAEASRTEDDLVGQGADLAPGTLLAAYRRGLFPMPEPESRTITWWCPVERGILPLDRLRVSRSLRRSCRRFEVRVDTAFDQVVSACADPRRDGGWIDEQIAAAYGDLHRLGWAHSVETWQDDRLVGGLYGVALGGLFAGESMFHRVTDASKVALVALVDLLRDEMADQRLLDVQWVTPHLARLGAVSLSRAAYLQRLARALEVPLPQVWT